MTDIQNKIAKQNKQFRLQSMDDEFLLYNPLQTKAIYLNATATLIWRLCDEQLSIEQMIDVLMQQYPQSRESIRTDVLIAIEELVASQALFLE